MLHNTLSVDYDKMSSMVDEQDFSDWLQGEMKKREWSQAELGRRAGMDRQVVSLYIARKIQQPSPENLKAFAQAFKLPLEVVFRAAGILPASASEDADTSEISHIYGELNEGNREDLLDYARLRLQKQERDKAGKRARTP